MNVRHTLSTIAFGLLAAVIVFRAADWLSRRTEPLPPVPKPNGYEELLAAAGRVQLPSGDWADWNDSQTREIADQNRTVLEKTRQALQAEAAVPLKTERGWGDRHAEELKKLKRLAMALALQSRADMAAGRTNQALQAHLDVLILGQTIARGGVVADGITALVLETIGYGSLRTAMPAMDGAECRVMAQELERAESRRESPERILATERLWLIRSHGIVARAAAWLSPETVAKRRSEFLQRSRQTISRTRRLMLALARRAYELESGKAPPTPAELVPKYLKAVPLDPISGEAFREFSGSGERAPAQGKEALGDL